MPSSCTHSGYVGRTDCDACMGAAQVIMLGLQLNESGTDDVFSNARQHFGQRAAPSWEPMFPPPRSRAAKSATKKHISIRWRRTASAVHSLPIRDGGGAADPAIDACQTTCASSHGVLNWPGHALSSRRPFGSFGGAYATGEKERFQSRVPVLQASCCSARSALWTQFFSTGMR